LFNYTSFVNVRAMNKPRWFGRILIFLLACTSLPAQATNFLSLPAEQRAQSEHFLKNDVKTDLQTNLNDRMTSAVMNTPLNIERITKNNQQILIDGAYEIIQRHAPTLSKSKFQASLSKIIASFSNTPPAAITIGAMVRGAVAIPGVPLDAGGSYGLQYNFYIAGGQLKMSSYQLFGAQGGIGTAMAKLEFYASLCFGGCFGGDPQGAYLGWDASSAAGLGAGTFYEFGVDLTDLFWSMMGKRAYGMEQLYSAPVFYVGFSVEYGVGTGISANLFYYDQIGKEKNLSKLYEPITPEMVSCQMDLFKRLVF
jgi:hypothetical protein